VSARIIDGKAIAAAMRAKLGARVATLPFRPGLAVVLVGDDPASSVYVRSKDRAATAAGIAAQAAVILREKGVAPGICRIRESGCQVDSCVALTAIDGIVYCGV